MILIYKEQRHDMARYFEQCVMHALTKICDMARGIQFVELEHYNTGAID